MQSITETDRYSLSQIVCQKIKRYIIENQLKPGAKIPSERDLVKILQVSRTVIREALSSLEMIGFVHIRHGEGVFIREPNLSPVSEQLLFHWETNNLKLSELLELRITLELAAIEKAIQAGTDEEFKELESLCDELNRDGHIPERFISLNMAFHRALVRFSHNTLYIQLAEIIESFFTKLERLVLKTDSLEAAIQGHIEVLNTLRSRDAIAARRSLKLLLDSMRLIEK
ncbi:FadR family transcriptional regulator [Paenibacillus mesophilus]|uniref:FadR/GntR family transcriptional regulator n=1 Tax=Paenibacillus mesophilus TaxID=2582849 RepID=UPI00110DCB1A|nr:FadR/GntR family transcriptional regulator [Paenibacillus mesophilus]TMV48756.1 FadR family transcriptional regulator [Paenibacillus mesophilus]